MKGINGKYHKRWEQIYIYMYYHLFYQKERVLAVSQMIYLGVEYQRLTSGAKCSSLKEGPFAVYSDCESSIA